VTDSLRTKFFRRYGVWTGKPTGYREDRTRCIAEVGGNGAWGRANARQCAKLRGRGPGGLYCRAHAAMVTDGRGVSLPALVEMRVKESH
jgi:hypothetical protein